MRLSLVNLVLVVVMIDLVFNVPVVVLFPFALGITSITDESVDVLGLQYGDKLSFNKAMTCPLSNRCVLFRNERI